MICLKSAGRNFIGSLEKIFEFDTFWILLVEIISETVREKKYFVDILSQIPNTINSKKKMHQNCVQNKNSVYIPSI
jgi:hypothetical protein